MNELNLYKLFGDIIAKSKVMKRFVTAPFYGDDLNKNNLGEQLQDVYNAIQDGKKYPLCLMFPPVEFPDFENNWSRFNCKLFFLTPPYDDSHGTANRNPFSSLSEHTIQQTWKDMNVCAKGFKKALIEIVYKNTQKGLRLPESAIVIQRFTQQGNDGVAGVSLTFDIDLMIDCEMEDYDESEINSFQFDNSELHPHHEH